MSIIKCIRTAAESTGFFLPVCKWGLELREKKKNIYIYSSHLQTNWTIWTERLLCLSILFNFCSSLLTCNHLKLLLRQIHPVFHSFLCGFKGFCFLGKAEDHLSQIQGDLTFYLMFLLILQHNCWSRRILWYIYGLVCSTLKTQYRFHSNYHHLMNQQ